LSGWNTSPRSRKEFIRTPNQALECARPNDQQEPVIHKRGFTAPVVRVNDRSPAQSPGRRAGILQHNDAVLNFADCPQAAATNERFWALKTGEGTDELPPIKERTDVYIGDHDVPLSYRLSARCGALVGHREPGAPAGQAARASPLASIAE
jgi:hypothetical protein